MKQQCKSLSCDCPTPVILVSHGVVMIKFDSNNLLLYFVNVFVISISDIDRTANTLIQYFKKYLDTTKY